MYEAKLYRILQDIIDAINETESFVDGVSLDVFIANREKILAVVKLLEIIGEAVKKIPDDKRKPYPLSASNSTISSHFSFN